jgi:Putative auto-transporter adhesin, head GIN domain
MRNLQPLRFSLSILMATLCHVLAPVQLVHAADVFATSKIIKPSGNMKSERRELNGFDGVAMGMSGIVEIKQGKVEGVTIETDENILPFVRTTVENGVLQVRWDSGTRVDSHNLNIRITVDAININRLAVSSSGEIRAAKLKSPTLSASVGGSGTIHVKAIEATSVRTDIGGSGNVVLAGATDSFNFSIGGSGKLRTDQLQANTVKANIGGSGSATIAAKDTLTIAMAGSGTLNYYGDPKVTLAKKGSGSVQRLGAAQR